MQLLLYIAVRMSRYAVRVMWLWTARVQLKDSGQKKVFIIYRRTKNEMPARAEEINHAEEEGIEFYLLTNPVEICGKEKVEGIKCIKMQLSEPDASGRARPEPIADSEFIIECDQVIMAIGTSPNPLIAKSERRIETTDRGLIIADKITGETTMKNVFAGGDAVTGAATVILAMGSGKRSAKAIIERLG